MGLNPAIFLVSPPKTTLTEGCVEKGMCHRRKIWLRPPDCRKPKSSQISKSRNVEFCASLRVCFERIRWGRPHKNLFLRDHSPQDLTPRRTPQNQASWMVALFKILPDPDEASDILAPRLTSSSKCPGQCVCCFVLFNRYWGIVTVPGFLRASQGGTHPQLRIASAWNLVRTPKEDFFSKITRQNCPFKAP